MSNDDEMHARHGRVLGELAELGAAMARGIVATLEQAEGTAAICELTLALSRISRAVRLAIVLEVRLARDAGEPWVRPAASDGASAHGPAADPPDREERPELPERLDCEDLREAPDAELDAILDGAALDDEAVETYVAGIRRDLRVASPSPAAATAVLAKRPEAAFRTNGGGRAALLAGAAAFSRNLRLVDSS